MEHNRSRFESMKVFIEVYIDNQSVFVIIQVHYCVDIHKPSIIKWVYPNKSSLLLKIDLQETQILQLN